MNNDLYIRTVIKDREREVSKYIVYNQIYSQYRDSSTSNGESVGESKNILSLWILMITKRLKGVVPINNKDGVKV